MSSRLSLEETFHFDKPGTLDKPGPIGRVVRLSIATLCLWAVWQLAVFSGVGALRSPSWWLAAGFALWLAPYVVNIGFGVKWGAWPRVISLALAAAGAIAAYLIAGNVLATPFYLTLNIWMLYIFTHLGLSFALSAVLATPGCEMRSIPHLLGMITGKKAIEHYCPGFIDNVDRWERGASSEAGDGNQED